MAYKCQVDVEALLKEKQQQVRRGEIDAHSAYSNSSYSWRLQLMNHLLLLNPFYQRWLYFDYRHDTWEDLGINIGEGIIVPFNNLLGVKKLPGAGAVKPGLSFSQSASNLGTWFLYLHNGPLKGPIQQSELVKMLRSRQLPAETMVFSAAMSVWQSAGALGLINYS
jgi:hypothetical protein